MEDGKGNTPRGASPRGRAGEPAAEPTRATGRPPAAIFMEPAIPAPREAEPETVEQRQPTPPASSATGPKVPDKPATAGSKATPPAAEHSGPASPVPPAKVAPAKTTPAKVATPAKAAPPVGAAPPVKVAPAAKATSQVKATKATRAAAPGKLTAASKATKATVPAKAVPTKTAPAKTSAGKATKAAAPAKAPDAVVDEPWVDPPAAPPGRVTGTEPGPVPSLWDRVRAEPRQAPELLARAAVERYGPEADRYTRWIRATYPAASDDRIAQAAARRFTAQARRSALAAVVGHGAGEAAALGWVQARMVLHIAAAYRLDPAAPDRAAELLTLMRPARFPVGAGVRAAGRGLATRLVPGAGLLLGALVNDAETGSLARRAISLYRPVPRLP